MISLSHLNKLVFFTILFTTLIFTTVFGEDEPADIWKSEENQNEQNIAVDNEKKITIESPIISEDIKKIVIKVEDEIEDQSRSVIGIFDPEKNNFNLNMLSDTDGNEIK